MARQMKRQARANTLFERLERGPVFIKSCSDEFTPTMVQESYQNWAKSWVLCELCALIPELKSRLDVLGNLKND